MECFAVSLRDSTPDAERGPTVGGTHTDAGVHTLTHIHMRLGGLLKDEEPTCVQPGPLSLSNSTPSS